MFGLEALDVLIGLVTVYLVFGLACTAIVEAIAAWLSLRSDKLEAAMKEFFHGNLEGSQTFVKAFYGHPLVQALSKGNRRPSYIPPETVEILKETDACLFGAITSKPGVKGYKSPIVRARQMFQLYKQEIETLKQLLADPQREKRSLESILGDRLRQINRRRS